MPLYVSRARVGNKTMRRDIKNVVEHAEVSEKAIEAYLIKRVTITGCLCLKYTNPNMVGYPDRLVVVPGGRVVWVEVKSRGKHPSPIQVFRFGELRELGHEVYTVSSREEVDEVIKHIKYEIQAARIPGNCPAVDPQP